MKRLFFAVLVLFLACGCSHKEGWSLVWMENFDGQAIDETVWSRIRKGPDPWDDMMSKRPDLAYIEDGNLVLLGKVNDGSGGDTTAFVTGGVWSKGKKSFQLARFEIRAKFSSTDGFWPALWLMPDNDSPWPLCGEIDIMEHYGLDAFVHQTIHSDYTVNVDSQNPRHSALADVDPNDWNVYAAEVYRDSVCFFTNNVKSFTYPRVEGKENQFPWADQPFFIILSNQFQGEEPGCQGAKKVTHPEQLPSELRVDWIKVYEWK